MRALVACAMVLPACFSPAPPQGAPCDPSAPTCPDDQACTAQAGGFFCGIHGGSDIDAPTGVTDTASTPDAMVDAAAIHVEYPATVAECINPAIPDRSFCRTINGNQQMVTDGMDTMTMTPWHGYVRFELDAQLAGKTITNVVLRLTATDDAKAPNPNSGEIYAVSAFTANSLDGTTPTKGTKLAGDQGPVNKLDVVDFTLPNDSVTAGDPVFLGVLPINNGGVNYWNSDGDKPPLLLINAE